MNCNYLRVKAKEIVIFIIEVIKFRCVYRFAPYDSLVEQSFVMLIIRPPKAVS